jgi:hypothetical protein
LGRPWYRCFTAIQPLSKQDGEAKSQRPGELTDLESSCEDRSAARNHQGTIRKRRKKSSPGPGDLDYIPTLSFPSSLPRLSTPSHRPPDGDPSTGKEQSKSQHVPRLLRAASQEFSSRTAHHLIPRVVGRCNLGDSIVPRGRYQNGND